MYKYIKKRLGKRFAIVLFSYLIFILTIIATGALVAIISSLIKFIPVW